MQCNLCFTDLLRPQWIFFLSEIREIVHENHVTRVFLSPLRLKTPPSSQVTTLLSRVSNSSDSLELRCNVTCIVLFYCYYNEFFSSEIREIVPEDHVTLVFLGEHLRLLSIGRWIVHCICIGTPSFRGLSCHCDLKGFKSSVHKRYSLFPSSNTMLCISRGHRLLNTNQ